LEKETIVGIISVLLGAILLWLTIKFPVKNNDGILLGNVNGYLSAIGLIVIGILIMIGYVHW
jgi:uncharacterized membrane-anchored protein